MADAAVRRVLGGDVLVLLDRADPAEGQLPAVPFPGVSSSLLPSPAAAD